MSIAGALRKRRERAETRKKKGLRLKLKIAGYSLAVVATVALIAFVGYSVYQYAYMAVVFVGRTMGIISAYDQDELARLNGAVVPTSIYSTTPIRQEVLEYEDDIRRIIVEVTKDYRSGTNLPDYMWDVGYLSWAANTEEDIEEGLKELCLAIIAVVTENGTISTNNVMGVPDFKEDGTDEDSIREGVFRLNYLAYKLFGGSEEILTNGPGVEIFMCYMQCYSYGYSFYDPFFVHNYQGEFYIPSHEVEGVEIAEVSGNYRYFVQAASDKFFELNGSGDPMFAQKIRDYFNPQAATGHEAIARVGQFEGLFLWPCEDKSITSEYYRYDPFTGIWECHGGVDIGCYEGQQIWAVADGTVTRVNRWDGWWDGDASSFNSLGNCVVITHTNGFQSVYGHMKSIAVSEGDYVVAGTYVGTCGESGRATGPHLHLTIKHHGDKMNPFDYVWFSKEGEYLTYNSDRRRMETNGGMR